MVTPQTASALFQAPPPPIPFPYFLSETPKVFTFGSPRLYKPKMAQWIGKRCRPTEPLGENTQVVNGFALKYRFVKAWFSKQVIPGKKRQKNRGNPVNY